MPRMGNEINNFVKVFLAGMKMLDDQDLNKAKGDYYKALAAKAGKNTDKKDEADLAYTQSQTRRNDALTANTGKAAPLTAVDQARIRALDAQTKKFSTRMTPEEEENFYKRLGVIPAAPAPAPSPVVPPAPLTPPAAVPGPGAALQPQKEEGEEEPAAQAIPTQPVLAAGEDQDPYKVPDEELDEAQQGVPVVRSAMGGAIPTLSAPTSPAEAPEEEAPESEGASLGEVVGAALHEIQDTYGLHEDNAALPGTDPARQGRLRAFHNNDAAMPPDQLDAVIQSVDPNGTEPDHNGLALNMLYNFYAKKGDTATAAKAAGSFLGAARQRSMEYGQDAVNALQKRDAQGASKALVAAYNEVPDGNEVTAQVNPQGIGKAVVNDIATGKVVSELPINPQFLAAAAQKFAAGDEFYTQLSRFAAAGMRAKPTLRAVVGGPVTRLISDALPGDDEEPDYEEDDEGSDEDATVQQAGYDSAEGGPDAGVGQQGAIPTKGAQFSDAPPIIPYHPNMDADQRRTLDQVNRRREADWREKQLHERAKQLNADVVDRTAKRTEEAARKEHNRNLRIEAEKRYTEERKAHADRYKNDPAYARDYDLREIDQRQAAIPRNVPGRSEIAQAVMERRYGDDTDRQQLEERRLDIAAKHTEKRTKFDKDYDDRIKPYAVAMETVIKSGRPEEKSGKIDTTLLPNIPDERKERMLRLSDRIAGMNDISPKEIAEAVYAITQKTDVTPKILKDGSLQVGSQRIILDRETFRQLANLRGLRETEYAAAKSAVEARKESQKVESASNAQDARERNDLADERAAQWERQADSRGGDPSITRAVESSRAAVDFRNRAQEADIRRRQMLGVE